MKKQQERQIKKLALQAERIREIPTQELVAAGGAGGVLDCGSSTTSATSHAIVRIGSAE